MILQFVLSGFEVQHDVKLKHFDNGLAFSDTLLAPMAMSYLQSLIIVLVLHSHKHLAVVMLQWCMT